MGQSLKLTVHKDPLVSRQVFFSYSLMSGTSRLISYVSVSAIASLHEIGYQK